MKVFCLLFFKKVGVFKSYFTSFYKEIKDYETRHKSFGSAFSKAEFFQKAVEFLKKICYNSKDRLLNNWRNYYEIACNRWK